MVDRRFISLFLSLALLLLLTGCHTPEPDAASDPLPPQPEPAQSQPPRIPVSIPFTLAFYPDYGLNPARAENRANLTLSSLLYEGLFAVDTAFQAQPVLCSTYSVSEDGLTWTLQLRQGVTFSDGSPLTGAAVAAALRAAMAPESHYAPRLSAIRSVTAGEGSVTLTLSAPNGALPLLLDVPVSLGEGDRPLGTGPYVLVEEADGTCVLNARSGWWQGKHLPFPRILLNTVTQADDLISAFDAGDVTLLDADLTGTNGLGYSGSYEVWDYATTSLVYLGFHTQRGPCRVQEVRQALSRGVDRAAIADTSFAHHAVAADLPVHPNSALYDETLASTTSYVPEAMAQGLEGKKLENQPLVLLVNSENSSKVAAAQRIAYQLESTGLSVTLERLPWEEYLAALEKGNFDLYVGEVRLTADFDLTPLVGSRGALNYGGWSDQETDALLAAYQAAGGQERAAAAKALYANLIRRAPITPICFKNSSVLTQWGRLSGLSPVRDNIFWGLEDWVLDP